MTMGASSDGVVEELESVVGLQPTAIAQLKQNSRHKDRNLRILIMFSIMQSQIENGLPNTTSRIEFDGGRCRTHGFGKV